MRINYCLSKVYAPNLQVSTFISPIVYRATPSVTASSRFANEQTATSSSHEPNKNATNNSDTIFLAKLGRRV